jgi:hypothetical protein
MEEIIKQLSQKYNKDKRVVKVICEYPFLFAKRKIEDPNDLRPIMITYFGKFVPKFSITPEVKISNTEKFSKRKAIAKARKQLEN